MDKLRDYDEITEEIIELYEEIVNMCSNNAHKNTSFEENVNKQHYTITFPKCFPHMVQINGKLKDLHNLSHAEREAVRTQKEIDKAKAERRQQRLEIMKKNLGLN